MSDSDKQALLDGTATIQTKIEILPNNSNEQPIILTEKNSVVSWDYEDFRYVKDEGWIGQFVARQVNGVVKNISDDFSMTDKEFVLHMGVKVGDNTTWYSLGNFLVNKITDDEVNDKTSFEALDYTKKFNQTYVDSITYPCTALELAQNVCEQCGCELGNADFKHSDWEIIGNVFTNGESCRDVLKAIGKLAYSWVRIDRDNKVYIDFTKETIVNSYDKITNHYYYNLKTQKEKFGPVNRVIIGYKDIEGERTKVEDTESIATNGVNEITIFDNPLVYNQELREKAIIGAEDLFELEYMPLEMLTVGHPWQKGKELVEVTDMEGKVHKTIPFDRTIQYFGHIKTKINVATNTKTNTEYAYESGIGGRLRKTEIAVDKINGKITEVIEEQDETTKKLNETISTVDETKQTISKVETTVEDITTTTQTSIGGNSLYLEDALESNALEYHVDGKSEQDGTPTPDAPVEIKSIPSIRNLFDENNYSYVPYANVNSTGLIISNASADLRCIYIKVKPKTTYTISANVSRNWVITTTSELPAIGVQGTTRIVTTSKTYTLTTGSTTQYLILRHDNSGMSETQNYLGVNLQIEEGSVAHDYVPYGAWVKVKITNEDETQEKEVLIDLNKPNLFNNSNITNGYFHNTTLVPNAEWGYYETNVFKPGKTYINASSTRMILDFYNGDTKISVLDHRSGLFTVPENTTKVYVSILLVNKDIQAIFEGTNAIPYYELSSIGDTKDTLDIVNGQVVLNEYIEKIDSYNGETITTNYISTTGELTTGATVYYILAEQKQIILPNVQIPLFEGVNHISLVDDLETTTSIKYYRNTPIAQDYVVQQQLDETNSNLSNTDNKVSQAQSDINDTNTNLNNNYYNKNQIDVMNTSTEQVITQIKNSVEATTSATNLQISILQEQLKNGVTSVKTETGYTFDKDGLKIQKTGSEMSSLLDNDGLVVKRNTTEVLTVRSSGVETENLKVRTYFTIGTNTRVENYKGGTGFFYIGGAS